MYSFATVLVPMELSWKQRWISQYVRIQLNATATTNTHHRRAPSTARWHNNIQFGCYMHGVFVYMRVYGASVCVSVHIHNRRIRRKHWEKPSSPRRNLCTHTAYFLSECYSSMEILRWVSLLPYNILKISTENRIKYQEIPTKSRLLLFCFKAKPQNHSEWHFKSSIIAINFNISLTYHKFKLQHECIS